MRCFLPFLLLLLSVSGCTGNYVFSDADYRPLGDPQSLNRGL
ncbi:hypothetical protein PS903_03844 [Pseudomonas fluorescens]|jgi:hypothetical protein|nr:hypothetical protein PS903_03844 [Pseudomonas fluorescens]